MVKYVGSLDEFKSELAQAGHKLVIVDFTASWCGPCRMIAPIFEQMAKDNSDVIFLKVDVDEASDVSASCEIKAMPTFQFYKNGEKVDEFTGASEQKLRDYLAKHK